MLTRVDQGLEHSAEQLLQSFSVLAGRRCSECNLATFAGRFGATSRDIATNFDTAYRPALVEADQAERAFAERRDCCCDATVL